MNANTGLVLAGVLMIFGGEAFCVLGPLAFERLVHITCHAVFYAGIGLVCVGAARRYRVRRARSALRSTQPRRGSARLRP
jgi:membrane protein implicated in regulation of membrane protease activity